MLRPPWSSRTSYAAAGWSATTPTEPVDPAVVDRMLAQRGAGAERRVQPGLGVPGAGHPRGRRRFWAATRRRPRATRTSWLAGMMRRAGGDRAVLQQGGLPRPLRRARQGLDRPRRGPLAGAVLAHRHRDGGAADPADRRRRGPGRLLLRHPAGPGRAVREAFGIPEDYDPVGAITVGHREDTGEGRRLAAPARRRTRSCIAGAGAPRSGWGPGQRAQSHRPDRPRSHTTGDRPCRSPDPATRSARDRRDAPRAAPSPSSRPWSGSRPSRTATRPGRRRGVRRVPRRARARSSRCCTSGSS